MKKSVLLIIGSLFMGCIVWNYAADCGVLIEASNCGTPQTLRGCVQTTEQVDCSLVPYVPDLRTTYICNTNYIKFSPNPQFKNDGSTSESGLSITFISIDCGTKYTGNCKERTPSTCSGTVLGKGFSHSVVPGCNEIDGDDPVSIPGGKVGTPSTDPACKPSPTPPTPPGE